MSKRSIFAFFLSCCLGLAADGPSIYRANCGFCHGTTGEGGRGSNLTGQLVHGNTLDDLKRVIHNGISGTQMPSFPSIEGEDLDQLALYVQQFSKGGGGQQQKSSGDAAAGRALYAAQGCASCHRIEGQGSIYGPDLTRVGAARSLDYLRASIMAPSQDVPREYAGVTVVGKDGRKVTGVRLNEDTFSVQLRTPAQSFRMFQKDEVGQVTAEKNSLMPAYKLSAQDLENLLAYMQSLRAPSQTAGKDAPVRR